MWQYPIVATFTGSQGILMDGHTEGVIRSIDLNADLGEEVTDDDALLGLVTSANVACGFHAGDEQVMARVCSIAAENGVRLGAQVSYLDREGFGRRAMEVSPEVLAGWVREQVELLDSIGSRFGVGVEYVKPHGALYNRAVVDAEQAAAVLAGSGDLPVLGLPGSQLLRLAAEAGRVVVPEGFPDRGYTPEGRLVPRDRPGALVEDVDEIAANALALAGSGTVRTLCLHGDSPGAVAAARRVLDELRRHDVEVRPWSR